MKFVAWLTIVDHDKNLQHRPEHLAYIGEQYRAGKVSLAGPFADKSGGLVVYEAETMEEARRLANNDPIVSSGARTVVVKSWPILDLAKL
ncbi:MAG: hypothetical protein C7B46_02020 [Sulfobacillus benefaciens]|uniref:YCII-related domain-containing protein n=1 Tax=Sulfobacillus benefaciens TaxID=453960 RepID=A0A2T2XL40_9FIRM|nr:MAG: hypothetical protein C7B46_02020 [Sulfobacillus benefaciens]